MSKSLLFIADYFDSKQNAGGAPVSLQNLVNLLLKEGFKCNVVARNKHFDTKDKFKSQLDKSTQSEQLTVDYIDGFLPYIIFKIIRNSSFSILYLNSFFSVLSIFSVFYFYFFQSKKKLIISTKGELYESALRSNNYFVKLVYIWFFNTFLSSRVVFHFSSAEELSISQKRLKISSFYIAADIYNVENVQCNKPKNKQELNIVFISRIDKKKNFKYACEVIANLDIRVNFDVFGVIADRQYFENSVAQLTEKHKYVNFNYNGGLSQDQVRSTFSNYDAFLFPTKGENFGYVVLESLDAGCPVLLSQDTTLWNDLSEYNAGFNIPFEEIDEWVRCLKHIYYEKTNGSRIYIDGALNYTSKKSIINQAKLHNLKAFSDV